MYYGAKGFKDDLLALVGPKAEVQVIVSRSSIPRSRRLRARFPVNGTGIPGGYRNDFFS